MADIAITAASVLMSASGQKLTGTIAAGVTITQGQALYQLANGNIGLADANGTPPANSFVGFALTGGSPGQPVEYCTIDPSFTTGGTLTSGAVVYLSDTPGAITVTYSDVASSATVIILGVTNTDGTLNFKPIVGGVK